MATSKAGLAGWGWDHTGPVWAARAFAPKSGQDHLGLGSVSSDRIATRNRLPHVWIELEDDCSKAEALLERFRAKLAETAVAIWQGKDVLENPTNPELARTPWASG